MIFVTGGAGFIGSNFVRDWLAHQSEPVLVVDKLTYAGNFENLDAVSGRPGFIFEQLDICDGDRILALLRQHRPRAVVHLAAESHVDRSIVGPGEFVRTNITGTFALLEATLEYWNRLADRAREAFRFLHVSTDEVYGSLWPGEPAFAEFTAYAPNNPYAASKAASDHLIRAYFRTYGLPTITTHCGNNYGPFQFPEKLIPLVILNAVEGKPLPVYGDGKHIRDWLYVSDHCSATRTVLERGSPGEVYNIGARSELRNIDVVETICQVLDDLRPKAAGRYASQILHVADRPGHDRRYATDPSKVEHELHWRPSETFASGIRKTIDWYLGHQQWLSNVRSGAYCQRRPRPHPLPDDRAADAGISVLNR